MCRRAVDIDNEELLRKRNIDAEFMSECSYINVKSEFDGRRGTGLNYIHILLRTPACSPMGITSRSIRFRFVDEVTKTVAYEKAIDIVDTLEAAYPHFRFTDSV
eukprot:GHVU01147380.1.p2 GENE.GHVU01147380.1~~GHVU01147380.1.p2  ORF type:complete len:104 (-),score=10.24 GHVU01147380.1:331-642(-)